MVRPVVALVALAALAFAGLGLMHGLGQTPPGLAPVMNGPNRPNAMAGVSVGEPRDRTFPSPHGHRPTLTGDRVGASAAPPDLPPWVDAEPGGPQFELGEPLEVDDDWGAELALAQSEPLDIGGDLDAGDPLAWALEPAHDLPVDIGDPLDADDAAASGAIVVLKVPVAIGFRLDAD